ncbi:MAG TPA: cytochrome c oxidase assembly protein, partial [Catenuloplanes sp.]
MAPPADATTPRHPLRWLAVAAGCVAVIVGGWALSTAGALDRNPGWTADSGPVIAWGLPLARLLAQSCAVLTIGFLLGCLLFAPTGPDGALSAVARRHAGLAGATAGGWAVASFCQLWFTAADLTGVGAAGVRISAFTDIAQYTLQGRALLIAIVAATAVQLCLRVARRPPAALAALLVAVGGTLPFAFTGHAATSGDHNTATTSLAVHILASSLWVGGLVALLGHARWDPTGLPRAARRFSGLALLCFLAVAGTGALNAWLRMGSFEALVTSDYGLLVQLKALALVALAAAGWWHRERTLPAMTSPLPGERRLFPRFAAAEIVVMAASLALATALGRSIPPRVPGTGGHSISEMLLGYAMPAPPTVERLLFDWRPDLFFAAGCLVAVICYLLGVKRLRQTPPGWPLRRTLCWLAGVLLLVAATSSGLARYGPVLFSVHLGQHLLVAVAAPILLVLGAPATLARRALPASHDARYPGAREWLNAARSSRAARLLIRPPVATTLWIAGAYVPYVTGGYEYALRNHPAHLAMYTFFIASGCLFFGSLLRSDASPSRSAQPARWAGLLAALVGHAVLGIVVIRTSDPFAAAWFAEL